MFANTRLKSRQSPIVSFGVLVLLVLSLLATVTNLAYATKGSSHVRNVIYIIGDGTGFPQLDIGRFILGEPLEVDKMPVQGDVRTRSANDPRTDSAAGGTAHATGILTNNDMVAMLPDGTRLTSVLQLAKQAGFATGVVTNDMIYGATPGSYLAHAPSRYDFDDIMVEAIFETAPDILMGGGLERFVDLELEQRIGATTYKLVRSRDELLAWDMEKEHHLLALFSNQTLKYAADRSDDDLTLAEMARVALDILENKDQPFFIMIEDDRIDGAGHQNDIRRIAHQSVAFNEMIKVVRQFVSERNDTLVIVSADHETGGLTRGTDHPNREVVMLGASFVANMLLEQIRGKDEQVIVSNLEPYVASGELKDLLSGEMSKERLVTALERSSYYFTTTGHTADNVPVYAEGPGAERFAAARHIAHLGQGVIDLLGLSE